MIVQLKQAKEKERKQGGERESDESIAHLQKLMIFSRDVCSSSIT